VGGAPAPGTKDTRTDGDTVVVVGGGIAGLAAAWELACSSPTPRVVVLEASDRLGGKIRTDVVGGRPVDLGPDAFLARRPEAVALAREIGIDADLVPPGSRRAYVWSRGRLRPLPDGLALGVPTRIGPVLRSGILSPRGLARAGLDLLAMSPSWRTRHRARPSQPAGPTGMPAGTVPARPAFDRAAGDIVETSLGREVVERLVDPLVGGIHAGPVDAMSAAAVYPPLLTASERPGSLVRALRAGAPAPPDGSAASAPPVFLTPRAGLGTFVDALVGALAAEGVAIRSSAPVTALERTAGGAHGHRRWRVHVDGEGGEGVVDAARVVVATPAPAAAELLGPVDDMLGRLLRTIEYATVTVVTFVLPADAVGRELDGTGFLVPAVEGWLTTACTWMSTKWSQLDRPDDVVLRASVGRFGDERAQSMGDDEVAAAVLAELTPVLALGRTPAAAPTATVVTRWPGAFPQYAVGHLDLVDRLEAAAAALGGLALAGAAYRGVGIPACIASGRRAARLLAGTEVPLQAGR